MNGAMTGCDFFLVRNLFAALTALKSKCKNWSAEELSRAEEEEGRKQTRNFNLSSKDGDKGKRNATECSQEKAKEQFGLFVTQDEAYCSHKIQKKRCTEQLKLLARRTRYGKLGDAQNNELA